MTDIEFIKAAKQACLDEFIKENEEYDDVNLSDVEVKWFKSMNNEYEAKIIVSPSLLTHSSPTKQGIYDVMYSEYDSSVVIYDADYSYISSNES